MRTRNLWTTLIILAAIGAAISVKAFVPATTHAAAWQVVTTPSRTSGAFPTTTPIVPSSATDSSNFFVGTGDGSVGSWILH